MIEAAGRPRREADGLYRLGLGRASCLLHKSRTDSGVGFEGWISQTRPLHHHETLFRSLCETVFSLACVRA